MIENLTGINHSFQEPLDPDIVVNTAEQSPDECVDDIIEGLVELGVLEETLEDRYEFSLTQSEEAEIKDRLRSRGFLE